MHAENYNPSNHPHKHTSTISEQSRFTWNIYHPFGPNNDLVCVEVGVKKGLFPRWRFVIPQSYSKYYYWGFGKANEPENIYANPIPKYYDHSVQIEGGPIVQWFGTTKALSSKVSAYIILTPPMPHYIMFGQAESSEAPPGKLQGITFGHHPAEGHFANKVNDINI